jgi:hypothetical protein
MIIFGVRYYGITSLNKKANYKKGIITIPPEPQKRRIAALF